MRIASGDELGLVQRQRASEIDNSTRRLTIETLFSQSNFCHANARDEVIALGKPPKDPQIRRSQVPHSAAGVAPRLHLPGILDRTTSDELVHQCLELFHWGGGAISIACHVGQCLFQPRDELREAEKCTLNRIARTERNFDPTEQILRFKLS